MTIAAEHPADDRYQLSCRVPLIQRGQHSAARLRSCRTQQTLNCRSPTRRRSRRKDAVGGEYRGGGGFIEKQPFWHGFGLPKLNQQTRQLYPLLFSSRQVPVIARPAPAVTQRHDVLRFIARVARTIRMPAHADDLLHAKREGHMTVLAHHGTGFASSVIGHSFSGLPNKLQRPLWGCR